MEYGQIIQNIYEQVKRKEDHGEVATYIPELAKVDPNHFGVYLTSIDGFRFGIGSCEDRFSIQSIVKVLSFCMATKILEAKLWDRLGVEPSGTPFNSLIQLERDNGIPRNPFINAGALVICDILISHLKNPKEDFLAFARAVSDNPKIDYSPRIAESEKSVGFRNKALCNFIKSYGNILNSPEEVTDFYFNLCSIEMSCKELSETFLFLANEGRKISDCQEIVTPSQAKRINAVMLTCGFYDESGEFAFRVGLPGKSGVGGGIIAVHPGKYSIGVWSPKLNKKGNSFKGIEFLEHFTTETRSSIF